MNPLNKDKIDNNIRKIELTNMEVNRLENNNSNMIFHNMKRMMKYLEPQELSIDINKEEISALIQSKSKITDEHKFYMTLFLYSSFIISFAVLFFHYQHQYIEVNKIFPLNHIESGWSSCTPITTIAQSTIVNAYPPDNSVQVNLANVYYATIDACSTQISKATVCSVENMHVVPNSNSISCFCDGQVASYDCIYTNSCSCINSICFFWFINQGGNFTTNKYVTLCNDNYNANSLCGQIYNLENPYSCSQKVYSTFITTVSLTFSASLLLFQILLRVLVSLSKVLLKK